MSDPFDFDHFLALPRLHGLLLSPDGERLVVTVDRPHPDGKKMTSTIWGLDPAGSSAPKRLTRSLNGETVAAFLPDGGLLFTSARPDPDVKPGDDEEPPAGLWLLPADGGEARLLVAPKAGVGFVRTARTSGTVLLGIDLFPGAADIEADTEREKARKDAGVGALLFEDFPIRFWDHYLGPRARHLLVAEPPEGSESPLGSLRDLTPEAGRELLEAVPDIAADGSTVVTRWRESAGGLDQETSNLLAIDAETGSRRQLTSGRNWYEIVVMSPDGRWAAAVHTMIPTPDHLTPVRLQLVELASGSVQDLTAGLDRWPQDPVWANDSSAVFFIADDGGHTAPFRVDVKTCAVTRLAADASYSDLCPAPDGSFVYALRSTMDRPPHVVRLAAAEADQTAVELGSPAMAEADLPRRGRVERVVAKADDGTPVSSWLILPEGASAESPAPLVVFVHGGPVGSWTTWHWRWNPHLIVEAGYAVLLPDPAISTGYGQEFMQRGWGRWGFEPFTDLVAAIDAAEARPDIDAKRTALMGGSFGGYMANWVAGQTDRFKCIVTHASLWELRGFHGTTDEGPWWEQEFGNPYADPSRYVEHSPSRFIDRIRTPMLVIHGELDHRVPISEALQLWTDLRRHGVPSRFLYFPDENHWILKPQNARLWYETVIAFLDEHVLGKPWRRPELV